MLFGGNIFLLNEASLTPSDFIVQRNNTNNQDKLQLISFVHIWYDGKIAGKYRINKKKHSI